MHIHYLISVIMDVHRQCVSCVLSVSQSKQQIMFDRLQMQQNLTLIHYILSKRMPITSKRTPANVGNIFSEEYSFNLC